MEERGEGQKWVTLLHRMGGGSILKKKGGPCQLQFHFLSEMIYSILPVQIIGSKRQHNTHQL